MNPRTLFLVLLLAGHAVADEWTVSGVEAMPVERIDEALSELSGATPTADNRMALAIALLRNGQDGKADSLLETLSDTSQASRASYYRGLLAESRGDFDAAENFYTVAADQYEDLDVQGLADDALFLLPVSRSLANAASVRKPNGFAYLSSSAKLVDGLVDPDDSAGLDEADTAFELLLAGSHTLLRPDDATSISIGGNLFSETYSDFSDYDVLLAGGWLQAQRKVGEHQWQLQVGLSDVNLGGSDYLGYTDIVVSDRFPVGGGWDMKVSALLRDVSSDDVEFDHYEGDVFQVSAGLEQQGANGWAWRYRFSSEDRGIESVQYENILNFVLDGELPYSRSWHQIEATYAFSWNNGLSQSLRAGLRSTQYDGTSSYLENDTDFRLTTTERDGTRWSLSTDLAWPVTEKLRLLGTLEVFDENSNIDQYDYSSTQFSLGFDWIF